MQKLSKLNNLELFFAGDGSRSDIDQHKIQACWEIIEKYFPKIPSNRKLIHSKNLGCKLAMKNNLDWFFDNRDYGVVLEDDCIPSDNFIIEIRKLLLDLKQSRNIFLISGFLPNLERNAINTDKTLTLSNFPMIWGWGSWKNKWKTYKLEIPDYNEIVDDFAQKYFGTNLKNKNRIYFKTIFKTLFKSVQEGRLNTWDYSLLASVWRNRQMGLFFPTNQVTNIGFGHSATHTKNNPPSWVATNYGNSNPSDFNSTNFDINFDNMMLEQVHKVNLRGFLEIQIRKYIKSV